MLISQHPIQIGSRFIATGHPPFVIAEMSGNHNQSLQRAFELVDAAAAAGAHALKLQTYTADTITLNVRGGDFEIRDQGSCKRSLVRSDLPAAIQLAAGPAPMPAQIAITDGYNIKKSIKN